MRKLNRDKQPTWTCRVMELLTKTDDFMTARQIRVAIGANENQVSAALIHLRRRHAVDCVEQDNALWWYATPETDDRVKRVDERVPEEPGTRCRRGKATHILMRRKS